MATDNQPEPPTDAGESRCADIQAVLFEYMTRELGPARSDLVREHLRRCPECTRAAADIQATLDALRTATETDGAPPLHLSDDRRKAIVWTITHPVLDWIHRHHKLVSVVVALIVLAIAAAVLRKVQIMDSLETPPGTEITIGVGPAPTTIPPAPPVPEPVP